MSYFEIFFIAIGLSMDAFAVSICKGLSLKKIELKNSLIVGFYFGLFQTIMPLIGYFLGSSLRNFIISIDHWIVFVLLGFIGLNMIMEDDNNSKKISNQGLDFKTMIVLAIATSIDALAVGITFAFLDVNIFFSTLMIGIITFIICAFGVKIGNVFGHKYERKAQVFGGIVLVLIGLKILMEHLFF